MHAVCLEQQLERRLTVGGSSGNRSVWIIIGALLFVFVIGSAVGGKSKSKPAPPKPLDNARAVLLPGGDGIDRTIVVPACNAPPDAAQPDDKAVVLQLTAGETARVVLVPDCIEKRDGAFEESGELPSAAFVLPVGSQSPRSPALKVVAETQVLVPHGSRATTVVVAPCTGVAAKKDVVLSPGEGATSDAAPPC